VSVTVISVIRSAVCGHAPVVTVWIPVWGRFDILTAIPSLTVPRRCCGLFRI